MQELQETLGATENQLWCVELDDSSDSNNNNQTAAGLRKCAHKDCIYPAVKRNAQGGSRNSASNGPKCVFHAQNWFPKKESKFHRGHLCLGPQYFRPLVGTRKVCCCENEYCIGIGYSAGGLVKIPINVETRKKVAQALGIGTRRALWAGSKLAEQLLTGGTAAPGSSSSIASASGDAEAPAAAAGRDLYLAPWHFSVQYRVYDEEIGTWRMKNPCKFKDVNIDRHGEIWTGMPPCDYDPKRFVDEEMQGQQGSDGGRCLLLPKNHPNLRFSSSSSSSRPTTASGGAPGVRSPFPAWVGEYLMAEGMDVIHTLDTLDIPPSLAPFSLAEVNAQWEQELGPREESSRTIAKRQRTSRAAATTTTTTQQQQQPLAATAASAQQQQPQQHCLSPEKRLLKEMENDKQNLCTILKARDKEIETLKQTIDDLVQNR
jgi:hypothetical protein